MKATGERHEGAGGDRKSENHGPNRMTVKTLKDLGITKNESSRAQRHHNLPQEKKQEIIEEGEGSIRL